MISRFEDSLCNQQGLTRINRYIIGAMKKKKDAFERCTGTACVKSFFELRVSFINTASLSITAKSSGLGVNTLRSRPLYVLCPLI